MTNLLTQEEKIYLKSVIKASKNAILAIELHQCSWGTEEGVPDRFLKLFYSDDFDFLPPIKQGYFTSLEVGKRYLIADLLNI